MEEQAEAAEESIQPLKRLRRGYQGGQSSSAAATASGPKTPLIMPKDEPTDLPNACPLELNASEGLVESPRPIVVNAKTGPELCSRNTGEQSISPKSVVACEACTVSSVGSPPHAMKLRDRGKQPVSPQTSAGEKRPLPHSSPQATHNKKLKIVRGTVPAPKKKRVSNYPLIIPKDEPVTDDMPEFVLPIAVIHPGWYSVIV